MGEEGRLRQLLSEDSRDSRRRRSQRGPAPRAMGDRRQRHRGTSEPLAAAGARLSSLSKETKSPLCKDTA